MQRSIAVVLALAMSLTLACGGTRQTETPSTLTIAYGISPTTLDPMMHTTTVVESILRNIYENLVERDDNVKVVPVLAESWSQVSENTLQFKLRKGVKFHNGEPMNAEAVKFSLDRLRDPNQKAGQARTFSTITSVDVVDDLTVNIVTKGSDPLLLARLTTAGAQIMSPKHVREIGDAQVAINPIGTGPYRFVSWVKDGDLTLEANTEYWGGAPSVKKVVIKAIPDDSARVAGLRTGAIDIMTNVPPSELESLGKDSKVAVKSVPSIRVMRAVMNNREGPTANPLVRRGINHAVDIDTIIDTILKGQAERVATALSPLHFGYDPDLKPYTHDLAKAKALFAEAGYPNGFEVTFDAPQGRYLADKEVAEAIAAQLGKAGVKVNLNINEWGKLQEKDASGTIGNISLFGHSTPLLDADQTFTEYFESRKEGRLTRTTYSNPTLDNLIVRGRTTLDPDQRLAIYKEAQRIVFEDAPWIFLYQLKDTYGIRAHVNWQPRADEAIPAKSVSFK